jgi:hypothetical protein
LNASEPERPAEVTNILRISTLKVRTGNPTLLDETIQQLPGCAAVVIDGSFDGDTCLIAVFSGESFLRFALQNQGYGEVVDA